MIKAAGGGGGKGMRVTWNDEEIKEAFRLAKSEAKSAFNDDRLLIEKFIDNPRHIEMQVMCDKHGNRVWLNERECSIQRRNQKVIEEAPSPFLTPEVRAEMGRQSLLLCKAVGYVNAGTVEFLVDSQRNFYFLEMNTRLQVEHPITECITGLDLVEIMIKVAQGEVLPITQKDVTIKGWAMESRVYAEDPLRSFLPSIGKLVRYKEPTDDGVRIDSGVLEGTEISIYYDPLISKLVTFGPNRENVINKMKRALDRYVIRGLNPNVNLLRDILSHERFIQGNLTTKYIPEEYKNGFNGHELTEDEKYSLLSVAAAIECVRNVRDSTVSSSTKVNPEIERIVNLVLSFENKMFNTTVTLDHERCVFLVNIDNQSHAIDLGIWDIDSEVIECKIDEVTYILQLHRIANLEYTIQYLGTLYNVGVMTPKEAQLLKFMPVPKVLDSKNQLVSPMAGNLVSIAVKPGDHVTIGQELAVVEAMKMQNMLRSKRDGIIKEVKVKPGTSIGLEQVILTFQ